MSPTRGRYRSDLNCSSIVSDPVVTLTVEDKWCLPDLDTGTNSSDYNHNVMSQRKRILLPPESKKTAKSVFPISAKQKGASTKIPAAEGDGDFKPQRAVGCNQRVGKKQAAEGENKAKRPRNPRKAKDGANTQMKLQLVSELVTAKPGYDDAFADDAYAYESSDSLEKVTSSYRYSRRPDKKTASTVGHGPSLAERHCSYMSHEQFQSLYPSSSHIFPPYQPLSQRSSRLFDNMLEQQAQAVSREHKNQSLNITDQRLSGVAKATKENENDFVLR